MEGITGTARQFSYSAEARAEGSSGRLQGVPIRDIRSFGLSLRRRPILEAPALPDAAVSEDPRVLGNCLSLHSVLL